MGTRSVKRHKGRHVHLAVKVIAYMQMLCHRETASRGTLTQCDITVTGHYRWIVKIKKNVPVHECVISTLLSSSCALKSVSQVFVLLRYGTHVKSCPPEVSKVFK